MSRSKAQPQHAGEWPGHTVGIVPWVQRGGARGPRADREFNQVGVSIPPYIANLNYTPAAKTASALDAADHEISVADARSGNDVGVLGQFLIRAESAASSKIELVEASLDDFARALAGVKAPVNAVSMANAAEALRCIVSAADSGEIDLDAIREAHYELMGDDLGEREYAGRFRDMQNWIGGSDYTPRGAVHVPPPPETVEGYMADLIVFANRDDLPAIAQAAIVHAQFESIHPFTDGNGRIGRALINAVLRRREVTTNMVVPISAVLGANREEYFDLVNNYRSGAAEAFVLKLGIGARAACLETHVSAGIFEAHRAQLANMADHRASSALTSIIKMLEERPALSMDDIEERFPLTPSSEVQRALALLEEGGVIHEVTARTRNKVWACTLAMAEHDGLAVRIARRVTADVV